MSEPNESPVIVALGRSFRFPIYCFVSSVKGDYIAICK